MYARKEKKRQKKLERAAQLLSEPDDNNVMYHEFVLPRRELIDAAKYRLHRIVAALSVSGVVMFGLMYGIVYFDSGYSGFGHLVLVIVFCFLIIAQGSLVQYIIFRKYARKVPGIYHRLSFRVRRYSTLGWVRGIPGSAEKLGRSELGHADG